jgi:Arc/MetJ family transcription regulator
MANTNIALDEALLAEASRVSGIEEKERLVKEALLAFIQSRSRKSLLELQGKIEFAPGYDYKVLRGDQS